jgi:hypothetical protein
MARHVRKNCEHNSMHKHGSLYHGHKYDTDNPRDIGAIPEDNRSQYNDSSMYNTSEMLNTDSNNNFYLSVHPLLQLG